MNPTEHTVKSASTPKTGLAALRGLLTGKGSGMPKIAPGSCLLCALVGAFAFATAAQAAPPPLVPDGSFSAVAQSAIGVAVDDSGSTSAGDVYVSSFINSGEPTAYKFSPAGQPIPPSPFGEPFGFSLSLAVNPKNGELYSLGASGSITTYDPESGAVVGTFPVTLTSGEDGFFEFFHRPPQIAADSAGDVYVPNTLENEVLEYGPEGGEPLHVFTGGPGEGALKEPTGVAVDSVGDLWVADSGDNRIEELSPADEPLDAIKSVGVHSVELYGHGDLLAIVRNNEDFCGKIGGANGECSHLVGYGPTGAKLLDVGAGSFESGSSGGAPLQPLVAVDEASGRVYVTDSSNQRVWVFGPSTPPLVVKEFAAEVSTSAAKLGALANPGGIPTTYRFEYGTTGAYGQSTPFPEGSVGEGVSAHTVWGAVSGLAPGTTYHYRVVATNELGTTYGPDQTFTTFTAEQAACPNEELRSGFSARLPDCRAYELVTAPTKNSVEAGAEAGNLTGGNLTAADGDAVLFEVNAPLPGAPSGGYREYLATRGPGGWSSQDLVPLESYSETTCEDEPSDGLFSVELSSSVIDYGHNGRADEPTGGQSEVQSCNAEGLQVVPGEPVGYQNLLQRDNATGAYRLINAPPPGVTPADAFLRGASADLSRVVFSEEAPLAPSAAYGVENLYEWDEGTVRLLTVLPDGEAVQGSLPEAHAGNNEISADGSHILFVSGGDLYVRIDGERTVQVDESQGGPESSGGGAFQAASADGAEIFFTDERKLTPDATAAAGEPDLYECALPEGASQCELSDLTVAGGGEHADVFRVSPLGSKDSSHVYFIARGVLASNSREYTDSEGRTVLEKAQAGQNNLYLWSGGTTTFIASGSTGYEALSGYGQASPDGTWFAFGTAKSLTGYDNTPAQGPPAEEIFLYDAASNQLACASCDPTGEKPVAGGPEPLNVEVVLSPSYISDGGRLFFDTREALVPSDTNSQLDVYEYEDGNLSLISSGTSSNPSTFVGASESGDDAFFITTQALVPQDTQEGMKAIYDARVDGGFPAPSSPPMCTTTDACRVPVPPLPGVFGAPPSATFSGIGNLVPPAAAKPKAKPKSKPAKCKRGFVRKKGKCERRPKQKAKKSAHANKTGK